MTPLRGLLAVLILAVGTVFADRTDRPEPPKPVKPAEPYPGGAAALPPGVRVIDEPEGFAATRDVLPGRLRLPSGRVAVDAYFTGDTKPLARRVATGSYPVRVTLARSLKSPRSAESVALATLVVSERPTVRWERATTVGVDGGIAGFSSAEGAQAIAALGEDRWLERYDELGRALEAHGYRVVLARAGEGTDLALFSTGLGDGGYTAYTGLDADGQPTRFVLDCGLLHLAWPADRPKASPAA